MITSREPDVSGGATRPIGDVFNIMLFEGPVLPGESLGKLRRFTLRNGQEIYAKRINPLRVRSPEEEIAVADQIERALQAADPRFHAQRFIGLVYDQGMFYLLSLAVPEARSMLDEPRSEAATIQAILASEDVTDPGGPVRLKDILVGQGPGGQEVFTVIDFESLPYQGDVLVTEAPIVNPPLASEAAVSPALAQSL